MSRKTGSESGQAVLEYILMMGVAVSLLGLIATTFRRTVASVWKVWSAEIAAPCPKCAPPEE